ncbi:hypothetical protein CWI42_120500 [Ordospora colligata]|uniref:Uncharacterized protein n=1 Tax=Ordospora colligata OC4 TaxID=1354746 RepID=A0A0B2UCS8_9MICR|nr:uncharacterized protein M896_120500 [Ordospora colligata OC4]KHN68831.1 hypothetical protein M896_120500 [Ordospora colligata OC4]TBU13865.1 hypothetical protein CWI40_120500 [Ordospora colligata]TBU14054.1 hypothetical protein CWI41_120500 [Ordospora colligata]TBU17723.1 hypothetical protein CWI42_120500 [Ordospora colligata]
MSMQNDRRGLRRQPRVIPMPLPAELREIIHDEAGDKASVVIDVLEGVSSTLSYENASSELLDILAPVVDGKAKMLVERIMEYSREECKGGKTYMAKNSSLLHDESVSAQTSSDMHRNQRRNAESDSKEGSKRRKAPEGVEVIVSKMNEGRHSVEDLKAYAARYGKVLGCRKIASDRFVVVFELLNSADEFVRSPEPVLNDISIKKFYHLVDANTKSDLRKLFEEQENIMKRMPGEFHTTLLNRLKKVNIQIRSLVMNDRPKEVVVDHKKGFDQENSLYYNCF